MSAWSSLFCTAQIFGIQNLNLLRRKQHLVNYGNGIEMDTVGHQFEPYLWLSCGLTWDVVPEQSW